MKGRYKTFTHSLYVCAVEMKITSFQTGVFAFKSKHKYSSISVLQCHCTTLLQFFTHKFTKVVSHFLLSLLTLGFVGLLCYFQFAAVSAGEFSIVSHHRQIVITIKYFVSNSAKLLYVVKSTQYNSITVQDLCTQ